MKGNNKIVFAGGKTGGHLFPGIAVASLLRRRGWRLLFIGSKGGLEEKVLKQYAFPLRLIPVGGLKGKSLLQTVINVTKLFPALFVSMMIILRERVDVVVSLGGYAAGPVALAAFLLRRRVVALEQNSIPGVTSRLVGKFADTVYLSFPDDKGFFPKGKTVLSGNPVRPDLVNASPYPIATEKKVLAIFGGSQGARSVNNIMVRLVREYPEIADEFHFLHQTGSADYEQTLAFYREHKIEATVEPFFDDIGQCYLAADVVVCRAGATTIAELISLKVPAIYIPFPHAADNHQYYNAKYMVDRGCGLLVDDTVPVEKKVVALKEAVDTMKEHREQFVAALESAVSSGDAATVIADDIERSMKESS